MPKSKFTDAQKEKAISEVKNGKSYSSVAKAMGTYASIIRGWCIEKGVTSKGKRIAKKKTEKANED